jgi:polyhydroxybutyrate depolymerase
MRSLFVLLLVFGLAACGGGGGGASSGGSGAPVAAPSALSYPSPQTAVVGAVFAPVTPSVTGVVAGYSVSPALPAGLSLNTSTGQISGTPTAEAPSATYTITAQNSGGATTFGVSLTVNPATTAALEPGAATTIGTGQRINLFFVQRVGGTPFPRYVDGSLVTWSSSNPGRAAVDANGNVTGMAEGATTITAQYQNFSLQLTVQVSGAWVVRTLPVAGQGVRRYAIYVPSGLSGAGARPALLAFHGGTGTAMGQAASSQLAKFAQERQIYAVFPEGSGALQTFNGGACCGTAQAQNVDDVGFTRALLADVRANYNVDAARIYATGFSNGGIMAHRLACGLADQLAGVAAVGGASGELDGAGLRYFTCSPARPITVLHMHAANDRNYPYAGGVGNDGISASNFYGVDATIANWITRNNVTNQATEERIGAWTVCRRYATPADGSRPSAPVVNCRSDAPDVYDSVNRIVFGGGHSWPGGVRSPGASSDVPLQDFNANAYLWSRLNP